MKCTLCLLVLLLAGCQNLTTDELRAKPKFHETYRCDLNYEVAYRALYKAVHAETDSEVYAQYNYLESEIFPESKTATLYHYIPGDFAGSLTAWIIDIEALDSGGCQIKGYAVNGDHWRNVQRFLRAVSASPKARLSQTGSDG